MEQPNNPLHAKRPVMLPEVTIKMHRPRQTQDHVWVTMEQGGRVLDSRRLSVDELPAYLYGVWALERELRDTMSDPEPDPAAGLANDTGSTGKKRS